MPKYGESLHRDKAWELLKCSALQEHVNMGDIELVFLNDHSHENITRERLFEYIRDMHYGACQNGPQTLSEFKVPFLFKVFYLFGIWITD